MILSVCATMIHCLSGPYFTFAEEGEVVFGRRLIAEERG